LKHFWQAGDISGGENLHIPTEASLRRRGSEE
jgi:hypothetical protein